MWCCQSNLEPSSQKERQKQAQHSRHRYDGEQAAATHPSGSGWHSVISHSAPTAATVRAGPGAIMPSRLEPSIARRTCCNKQNSTQRHEQAQHCSHHKSRFATKLHLDGSDCSGCCSMRTSRRYRGSKMCSRILSPTATCKHLLVCDTSHLLSHALLEIKISTTWWTCARWYLAAWTT